MHTNAETKYLPQHNKPALKEMFILSLSLKLDYIHLVYLSMPKLNQQREIGRYLDKKMNYPKKTI